jgi:cell division initiation protein
LKEIDMGRLTAQDVREREFKQSALGYSKEQVGEFLEAVADELETLSKELNQLFQEHKEAKLALQTYTNVEETLRETLLQAKVSAQDIQKNASKEADNLLQKARVEKDALLFSAKEDLSAMQAELRQLRVKRDEMLTRMKNLLRSNLEVLDDIFPDRQDPLISTAEDLTDEQIIDFSQADMSVEDLPKDPVPEQQELSQEPAAESEEDSDEDDVFNIPSDREHV